MSLGSGAGVSAMQRAVDYAETKGMLIVSIAGNYSNSEPFHPAAYPTVVSVGATNASRELAAISNFGENTDLVAPGEDVLSTLSDGSSITVTGTSISAPFVAGIAALLLAQDPTRTPEDLRKLLYSGAVDLGEPGRDDQFGHGLLNGPKTLGLPTSSSYLPILRR